MQLTSNDCLAAAWTYCAPGRSKEFDFPRGFWPDVARVAMEMFEQQTIVPVLDFRPTRTERGDAPEIVRPSKLIKKSGLDLSLLKINI